MKTIIHVMTLILVALAASACQADDAPPPTAEPSAAQPTEEVLTVNPAAYPAYPVLPVEEVVGDGEGLYPFLMDGDMITWAQTVTLIQSQQVTSVVQSHDLSLLVTLADGRSLLAQQPEIDAILEVIRDCGDPCKNIAVASE